VGGAERQLAALAPLLNARNVEVCVLTRRYSGLAPFEIIEDVPVYRLPIIKPKPVAALMFTLAALPLLSRLRPHLIHAHGLLSPVTTAITAGRILGTPVVAKPMRGGAWGDLDVIKRKPLTHRRLRLLQKHVDAFPVINSEIDTELAGIGISPERRVFIPNGVNLEKLAPLAPAEKQALRNSLQLPDGPIAIFTGRLEVEKRVDQLIAIWPAVRAVHPQALLLILGEGTEESSLKQAAGDGVQFLGRVDDVAPYLKAADIFVLPSATEGLSNSLLEALAAGLPAIATAVGGTPDLIEHQQSGWLVPPDTPSALQEAAITLLNDKQNRQKLGLQGRARVLKDYALPVTADRLARLYRQLIRDQSLEMS
jgi:glycosyltransferase involved in cell wall biosynthesis